MPSKDPNRDVDREWWDNFRGRCLTCIHAAKTNRKMEMMCMFGKAARDHGFGSRPGGTWNGTPVSKLFGCIYWVSIEHKESNVRPNKAKEPTGNNESNEIPF